MRQGRIWSRSYKSLSSPSSPSSSSDRFRFSSVQHCSYPSLRSTCIPRSSTTGCSLGASSCSLLSLFLLPPAVEPRGPERQALPLYADGATTSRGRTIDASLEKIGQQADKVHKAYQGLIEFGGDERHLENFEHRHQRTSTEHNDILAHADEVLGEVEGPQRQQQPG
jgi:hypothetical protein